MGTPIRDSKEVEELYDRKKNLIAFIYIIVLRNV